MREFMPSNVEIVGVHVASEKSFYFVTRWGFGDTE